MSIYVNPSSYYLIIKVLGRMIYFLFHFNQYLYFVKRLFLNLLPSSHESYFLQTKKHPNRIRVNIVTCPYNTDFSKFVPL